jgi:acyl-CoA thioester hydrolase
MAAMSEGRVTSAPWPDLAGRITGKEHVLPVRVYYEDTDFSGVVYHANYLKYCERGRSDFLRLLDVHHSKLFSHAGQGDRLGFTVSRMTTKFQAPAHIDDVLEVRTQFTSLGGARLELSQAVTRDGDGVFRAELTVALVDGTGRPQRLPVEMRDRFAPYLLAEGCDK